MLKTGGNITKHVRPLLNLANGNQRGLERVFETLRGRSQSRFSDDQCLAEIINVLQSLDFSILKQDKFDLTVTHPLAPDRSVSLPLQTNDDRQTDPEGWTLAFALLHFQELEFYLPYISRRAARAVSTSRLTGQRPFNSSEPDYDKDGFLTDYTG